MHFDEARSLLSYGIRSYVYRVGVGRAKWHFHLAESLHTTPPSVLTTHAFETNVVPNGDVEAFG